VGAVFVVEGLVLAQGVHQVGLVPDESAVEELSSAVAGPAFHDRVHRGHPHPVLYGLDALAGEHSVEAGRVAHVAVSDQVCDLCFGVLDVHDQIPGELGGPGRGGLAGDPEDADASGGVFDHCQHGSAASSPCTRL
jgi:hypothetical protein